MEEPTYEEIEDIETVTTVIPYDGWTASLNAGSPSSSKQVENIDVTYVAIVETRIRHPASQSTPNAAIEGNLEELGNQMEEVGFDPNFVTPKRPINKTNKSQKTEYKHPTPPDYVDLYSFMTSMLSPPDVTPNRRLSFRDCSDEDPMRDSVRSAESSRSDVAEMSTIDALEESLFELADNVEDYITEVTSPDGPSTSAAVQPARRMELDRKLNALAQKFQSWDDAYESPKSPALSRLTEVNDRLEEINQSAATPGRNRSAATPGSNRSAATPGRNRSTATPGRNRSTATPGSNRSAATPGRNRSAGTPVSNRSAATLGSNRSAGTPGRNRSAATPGSSRSANASYSRPEHVDVQHPGDVATPGNRQLARNLNTSYDRADEIQVMTSSPGLEEYTVRRKTFSATPSGTIMEEEGEVGEGDDDFKESLKRVGAIWKKWAPKGLWERYQKRRRLRRKMKPIRIPEGVTTEERMELELQERTRRYNLLEYSSPHTVDKLMKIPYYRDASPLYNKEHKPANYKQRDIGFFKNANKDN